MNEEHPTFVAVLPSIYPTYTRRCLASCKFDPDQILVVDNSRDNIGVAAAWNQGVAFMRERNAEWLVILSAAVRFGPAGGLDLIAKLTPEMTACEAGNGLGWHLIAFPAWLFDRFGLFDENFVAYFEDNDFARRIIATDLDLMLRWPKVDVDAHWVGNAHGLKFARVEIDHEAGRDYYARKWGGPPSEERFSEPWEGRQPLGWWPTPPTRMPSRRLPVLIDVEASLEAARDRQDTHGMVKTIEDVERYRLIIETTQPDVIAEMGTFSSKSALWFDQFAEVITVDLTPYIGDETRAACNRTTWITGNTIDDKTVRLVRSLTRGKRTMVVLDSDHSAAHVAAEIKAYGPMVTPGCYMVVEDGLVRWMDDNDGYDGSPLDAIEELLFTSSDWERDEVIEQLSPQSQMPAGWLRKVER